MASPNKIKEMMVERLKPEKAEGIDAVIQIDLTGDNGGQFYLQIADGTVTANDGVSDDARMTMKASAEDWHKVITGQMNGMQAFMSGKLKVTGDMGLAMKLQSALG